MSGALRTVKLVVACTIPLSIGYYLVYDGISDFKKQLSIKPTNDINNTKAVGDKQK
mgnify:FL=1